MARPKKNKIEPTTEQTTEIIKTLFNETRENIKVLVQAASLQNNDTSLSLAIKNELKSHLDILSRLRKTYLPKVDSSEPIPVEDRSDTTVMAWT